MFTDFFWRFLLLEMFIMALVSTNCPNLHLQTQYCNSKVVFTAQHPVNKTGPYKMKIITVFKGNDTLQKISKGNMVTVVTDVDFDKKIEGVPFGNVWVILGEEKNGNVYAGKCVRFYTFKWLQKEHQKALYDDDYQRGCDCTDEISNDSVALLCEYESSFLVKTKGKCTWDENETFRMCKIVRAFLMRKKVNSTKQH